MPYEGTRLGDIGGTTSGLALTCEKSREMLVLAMLRLEGCFNHGEPTYPAHFGLTMWLFVRSRRPGECTTTPGPFGQTTTTRGRLTPHSDTGFVWRHHDIGFSLDHSIAVVPGRRSHNEPTGLNVMGRWAGRAVDSTVEGTSQQNGSTGHRRWRG